MCDTEDGEERVHCGRRLGHVTDLEKKARKALRSVHKIAFGYSKEGAEKTAEFGEVWTVLCWQQNVVATNKGCDKIALKRTHSVDAVRKDLSTLACEKRLVVEKC